MDTRPMPFGAVVTTCALLVGSACVMTRQSVALAADGAYQLVRVLESGDVYGASSRFLAASAHQAAVVIAVRAGLTDTSLLTILLGLGQLVLPAVLWSLAIVLSRSDRLVCAVVTMVAALCTGATWFVSVSEIVLVVPLTVLVAVLLWRPSAWRWLELALCCTAAVVLVAGYETSLLTGGVLGGWALLRARRSGGRIERYGCRAVATLSFAAMLVAIDGMRTGRNQAHSQSFLYFVVSLQPWPFYLALAGIAAVTAGLGPWLPGPARLMTFVAGVSALVVAVPGFQPRAVTAFEARGGVAVAGFALEAFLLWRWVEGRASRLPPQQAQPCSRWSRHGQHILAGLPIALVAAMVVVNARPLLSWSRSLDAFRESVDSSVGITEISVLPSNRRAVIWGWTASSLSLLVRSSASDGVLVDHDPSFLPFPPVDARAQLPDSFGWRCSLPC